MPFSSTFSRARRQRRELHAVEAKAGRLRLDVRVVVAQERLLDDVLGLAHAPEHAVGDGERRRPQLLVQVRVCHGSAEAFDDRAGYALTSQIFIDETI